METDTDLEVTILTNGTFPSAEAAGEAFLREYIDGNGKLPEESYVNGEGYFYCCFSDVGDKYEYYVKNAADHFCAFYGAKIRVDAIDNIFDETEVTFHGGVDPTEAAKNRRNDLGDVVAKIAFVKSFIREIGLASADKARLVRKYENFVADLERTAKAMDGK